MCPSGTYCRTFHIHIGFTGTAAQPSCCKFPTAPEEASQGFRFHNFALAIEIRGDQFILNIVFYSRCRISFPGAVQVNNKAEMSCPWDIESNQVCSIWAPAFQCKYSKSWGETLAYINLSSFGYIDSIRLPLFKVQHRSHNNPLN